LLASGCYLGTHLAGATAPGVLVQGDLGLTGMHEDQPDDRFSGGGTALMLATDDHELVGLGLTAALDHRLGGTYASRWFASSQLSWVRGIDSGQASDPSEALPAGSSAMALTLGLSRTPEVSSETMSWAALSAEVMLGRVTFDDMDDRWFVAVGIGFRFAPVDALCFVQSYSVCGNADENF
jgi:hypothetical protein